MTYTREGEDMSEMIAKCETCMEPIFEGDRYLCDPEAGVYECASCAPTWSDMLASHEDWCSAETGDPLTAEEAKAWADRHVAAGGSLSDSMAT